MATIEGALRSVEDSLDKLIGRFCGSDDQALRLFRLRTKLLQTLSQVLQASNVDLSGLDAIDALVHLAADVSDLPSNGGGSFNTVVDDIGSVLDQLLARVTGLRNS